MLREVTCDLHSQLKSFEESTGKIGSTMKLCQRISSYSFEILIRNIELETMNSSSFSRFVTLYV